PAPVAAPTPPAAVAAPQAPQPPAPPEVRARSEDGDAEDGDAEEDVQQEVREDIRKQFHRTRDRLKRNNRSGGRNVVSRGQSLEVKAGQTVRSAVVYGGNLTVDGHVEDDAVAFGGNLEIRGVVEGDAHAFGGNVILKPGAHVEGDVSSFGGTVEREDGSDVEGSINTFGGANIGRIVAGELKKGLKEPHDTGHNAHRGSDDDDDNEGGLAGFILTFAVLFGLGFLGQMFFPTRMKQLGDEIRARPMQSGLTGLLGLIAMVPLTVVLCITIIGIPAALVLWMAAPLAAALGFAAVASELGTRLPVMRGRKTQAVVLALGLLVLLVVGAIPVFGVIVSFLAAMVALGAVIRTRFGYRGRGSGMPERIPTSSEQPI
ncbi:polymer-forming cytoskeletal protein, partial [Myxococcus sp. K15C18031901]|uniref:polymer-forming cytoskeletal protein n=1 Tax=Myxococcus dinghuensis TaxID=2906761 RepID=UPI0020A80EFF